MSTDRTPRQVALAHAVVGFATCLCLIVFYTGASAFGPINDVGNAALGVLSCALAWVLRPRRTVLLGFAAIGAALTVLGTVLVLAGVTGFYLAGLWSSFGFALIGVWLVGVRGFLPGAVMLLGLVGVPGILMGLDDMGSAPGWTFAAGISWAGTYLLFPAWSLRLARQDRPERVL
ncbi:hypothetical protein [Kribbella sp.]|uniref:hypothetical protein n=1 Tax=Kribbella sp. TaxID=1871183 RepID=UPI002D4B673C|nr:hypothetical protein [Kribbella sp.]HZX08364.1 hypothetical protein [Kribbella sp.]